MATKTGKPKTKVKDTKADVPATLPPVDKTRHLQIVSVPGKTDDRILADLVTDGLASNASTAIRYIKPDQGDVSLTDLVASLRDQGEAVNRGDLAAAERMLAAQAVALNAVFSEMARRAALNIGEHLGATESYMRLALKAQSQSRATVETLATIKNPPVVFARQANINNGGQQQVNNGAGPNAADSVQARAGAHAENLPSAQSELSEATHELLQDTRASSAVGDALPSASPVGAVNRASHG
jgi:hypothetical protein